MLLNEFCLYDRNFQCFRDHVGSFEGEFALFVQEFERLDLEVKEAIRRDEFLKFGELRDRIIE